MTGLIQPLNFFAVLVTFLALSIALINIKEALQRGRVFGLKNIISVFAILYFIMPAVIMFFNVSVIVNGARVYTDYGKLLISAICAMMFLLMSRTIRYQSYRNEVGDTGWAWLSLTCLSAYSFIGLINFINNIDAYAIFNEISSGHFSAIRDIMYEASTRGNGGLGYVPKVLQIAFAGFLILVDRSRSKLIFALLAPLVILELMSMSRITIASMLFVSAYCYESSADYNKKLYIFAILSLCLVFFLRVVLFISFDESYSGWLNDAFLVNEKGIEIIGEFFNTYATYHMTSTIPETSLTESEIYKLITYNILLPPGFSRYLYDATGETFAIERVGALITSFYGPHPAHLSLIDIDMFGIFGILGFFIYFAFACFVSKKSSAVYIVLYLYLIGVFYIPFRGSLLLNSPRLIWLLIALLLSRFLYKIVFAKFKEK